MPLRSIFISEGIYQRLKNLKKEGESFSDLLEKLMVNECNIYDAKDFYESPIKKVDSMEIFLE